MPIRKSANINELITKTPQAKVAIDQLAVTRPQDNARVFFPGADGEMAKAAAKMLNEQADVAATMATLKTSLTNIYEQQVKPNL